MRIGFNKNTLSFSTLLIFVLIYFSNDTLLFGTNSNRFFFWLQVGVLLVAFCILMLNTKRVNVNLLVIVFPMMILILLTQIVNDDNAYIKYIYNIFQMCLAILVVSNINIDTFVETYKNVMYVLAVFSLITFAGWYLINPIIRLFPLVINESGDHFFYLGLGLMQDKTFSLIPRLYGIFREPGVYTCFLIFALILELFIAKERTIKKSLVYSCVLILTFSTAAYFLLAFVFAVYFGNNFFSNASDKKKSSLFLCILMIFIICFILIVGTESIWELVFKKLYVTNDSLDSRLGSVEGNLLLFYESPILGNGWSYVETNFENYTMQGIYKGNHNTNTLLKHMALYGIVPCCIVILGIISFFKSTTKNKMTPFFCSIMWIITLGNEDLTTNIIYYLVPFYGIANTNLVRKLKRNHDI